MECVVLCVYELEERSGAQVQGRVTRGGMQVRHSGSTEQAELQWRVFVGHSRLLVPQASENLVELPGGAG